ncbi:MAG: hypothetical protein RLZ42_843 [Armatimonadota bacterium]
MTPTLSSRRSAQIGQRKPITMLPAGECVYVGFCDNNVSPHYLVVGENLFIFLSSTLDVADMVRSVQEVLGQLPASCGWRPTDPDSAIRLDWIAQAMTVSEIDNSRSSAVMPRRRLSPA